MDSDSDFSDNETLQVLVPTPEPDSGERTPLLGRNNGDDANGTANGHHHHNHHHHHHHDKTYEYEGLPWWRVPSVYWLVGPFFLFIMAFGGTIVPKLNLILQLVCRRYYADQSIHDDNGSSPIFSINEPTNPQCLDPAVQRRVTSLMLAINLVVGLLAAVVAPQLGHLADRYGRTRVMALASCGGALAEVVTIFIVRFADTIDYHWFILSAVFEGLAGSFVTGSLLGHSYVSDCTPPSRRGIAVGYLHACIFTGIALGPVLAAWLVEMTGSLLSVFYVALGCNVFYGLFVLLVVPESLSRKDQLEAREKHARQREELAMRTGSSWLASLRTWHPLAPLSALVPRGPGSSPQLVRNILALATCDAVLLASAMSAWPVIILYSEYTFHWGNLETSTMLSTLASVRVVALLGIFPLLNYIWRILPARRRAREQAAAGITLVTSAEKNQGADKLDIWIVRIAVAADILGSLGYTLAPSAHLFFASGMATALGGLGSATIQTIITKHVPPQRLGQLLGAIGLLHGLGRVAGPLLFNSVYYATVGSFPQAVFALMCGLFTFAFFVSFLIRPGVYMSDVGEARPQREGDGAENAALIEEEVAA